MEKFLGLGGIGGHLFVRQTATPSTRTGPPPSAIRRSRPSFRFGHLALNTVTRERRFSSSTGR